MKLRTCLLVILAGITSISSICDNGTSRFGTEYDLLFQIYISTHSPEYGAPPVPALDDLELIDDPLLSTSDISAYEWRSHTIHFPETVHERLKEWGNLLHRIFVVTVEDERIYWGKFMDDLDSECCRNPVIKLIPRHPDGRNTTPKTLVIQQEFIRPDNEPDIRFDNRVFHALRKAGVLINGGISME